MGVLVTAMTPALAPANTKAASKQTYYTIRLLVDRGRVDDAFRAYAYFRWVDDALDAQPTRGWAHAEADRLARTAFLDRQAALLDACLRGEPRVDPDPHESLLVELCRHAGPTDIGLHAYLRQMMRVMAFDVRRRGRLVSRAELDEYTRSLAIAVTEAMHHFIGHGGAAPRDESRYRAVSGAHIVHMLRDTYADVAAGYFNVPREVLEASSIAPSDIHCEAYRGWVAERVRQARADFAIGVSSLARVESLRFRAASLAYVARFERVLDTIERDGFQLRPVYAGGASVASGVRIAAALGRSLVGHARSADPLTARGSPRGRRA